MQPIQFFHPGQPIGKPKRFNRETGHGYNDRETQAYMKALAWSAKIAMGNRPPFRGPLKLTVRAGFGVPVSWSNADRALALSHQYLPDVVPDFDNICKTLGDACKGVLWRDDAIICQVTFAKCYAAHPGLTVSVEPLPTRDSHDR